MRVRGSERVLYGLDQPDHDDDEQGEDDDGRAGPGHDVLDQARAMRGGR